MPRVVDLTGQRFGRLTVLTRVGSDKFYNSLWKCECICGSMITVICNHLLSGHTKSCGCLRKDVAKKQMTTHGESKSVSYSTWEKIMQRCTNKNNERYYDYGGRGIGVCQRWLKFENFYKDMGKRPSSKYSIERINNDKGYFKENCKWATSIEQSRNRRVYKNNKTGMSGVVWKQRVGKYVAQIGVNYESVHLGYFEKINDAIKARQEAEIKYWNNK